jgi:hypothetical protein
VAKVHAIAATGQAVLGLLADNIPKVEFPDARFELYQTANFGSGMKEGVSLFLYRIEINFGIKTALKQTAANGVNRYPPLPLDLYYLLTVWAADAIKQQRLLGWVMRTLEDCSSLSANRLNHYSSETDVFSPNEKVELMYQQISLQELSNLWSAFKVSLPFSVAYKASTVGIDSALFPDEIIPVQTRQIEIVKN